MAKKRRLWKSWLSIPIWLITGIALFFLFSGIYDFIVLDRSIVRTGIIIGSIILLVVLVIIQLVPLEFLSRQARKQMGG